MNHVYINDGGPDFSESVEAGKEEHELETLVEVLGDDDAQRAAEGHLLSDLVTAAQR